MSQSQRLRNSDLVRIYRLIGECRDLGHDSVLWRTHLLEELCRWLGAQVGTSAEVENYLSPRPRMVGDATVGWLHPAQAAHRERHLEEKSLSGDPMWEAAMRRLGETPELLVASTDQLVPRTEWLRSQHFNEYRRPADADRSLYAFYPAPEEERLFGVTLTRTVGEPDFGERARKICYWLMHELRPLVGRQLAAPGEPSCTVLAPRVQQVLQCLLEGDSEKEAGLRLGISAATVHQYVTVLYRHYGVSSRAELLARQLRFNRR